MSSSKPLRVGIVTADIVGPVRNGGIGTWYHALATALAADGHQVTVLYSLGTWCENLTLERWIDTYAKQNIEFVPLPPFDKAIVDAALWVRVSYEVCEWLRDRERAGRGFDILHFHEWRGNGFYPVMARRQGLAFQNTVICVGTHSPLLWHKFGMAEPITELEELQTDYLERRSVALCDVVVSPSRYMIDWITSQGWTLPKRVEIRQYIQSHFLPTETTPEPTPQPVREICFFGRLETRKGITLFCDAIDLLCQRRDRMTADGVSITFLGKKARIGNVESEAFLAQRSAGWTLPWRIVDTLDHAGAIDYLRQPGRMGVICSLLENSPNTVLECLVNRVPCLCTDIGGNPELLAAPDRERVTFPPRPRALADKLLAAVNEGLAPARPAIAPERTRDEWLDWHRRIVDEIPPAAPVVAGEPKVSICITHRNRHKLLQQAIESVRAQDYQNLEVIVVDDGSDEPAVLAYLDELERDFVARNWRVLRQTNQYLGAARNLAARHATGDYLLFMDDDNYAKPHEVSTFVRAACHSDADVLTCPLDVFQGPDAPVEGLPQTHRWLPLGGAVNVAIFTNLIGDANALVKRSTFEALGGFTEDFGVGHEDWELFAKAALGGYEVQVLPEPLFFYRVAAASMLRTTSGFANHMRSLRPYLKAAPQIRTAIEYAQSLFTLLIQRTTDASTLYDKAIGLETALATKSAEAMAHAEVAAAHARLAAEHEARAVAITEASDARSTELNARLVAMEKELAEARLAAEQSERRAAEEAARAAAAEEAAKEMDQARLAAEARAADAERAAHDALEVASAEAAARAEYVRVHGNGDAAGYQRLVDQHWNSFSWRLSAPVRNALLVARGLKPQQKPSVSTRYEAEQVLDSIRSSASWEAVGLLRVVGRAVGGRRGKNSDHRKS